MTTESNSPTPDDLSRIAADQGWMIRDDLMPTFVDAITGLADSYQRIEQWARMDSTVRTPTAPEIADRDSGSPSADPSWAWTCRIQRTDVGPLSGVTVAIKDSIAVAGLPTAMGSRILDGDAAPPIAHHDATIVDRLLDAGAIITGKSTTEDLCIGGSSCTSQPEPVENPHHPGRSAGGSSSGSAALLARGMVDLALGADQGGSIRIPAALCGVVGLKPTFGLVPFTGVQGLAWGLDHVGPMARNVEGVARALDVIAGPDGIDRRSTGCAPPEALESLTHGVEGLRVAVVPEGFALSIAGDAAYPGSAAAADQVRDTVEQLRDLGALVDDVPVPWHERARDIYGPLLIEAAVITLWRSYGRATADIAWAGDTPIDRIISGLRERPDLMSPPTQLVALAGSWFLDRGRGRSLDQASELVVMLRRDYDRVLREYDVLVHPTTAPAGIPGPLSTDPVDMVVESLAYFHNTCATNLTGHPSVTVPTGGLDGVGVHITGPHGGDGLVLRVAHAIEQLVSR